MTSFELNSTLYTKPEIEDILSLSFPYTVENVVEQKKILFLELSNDNMLQGEKKTDLATFVEEISSRLMKDIVKKEEGKLLLGNKGEDKEDKADTPSSSFLSKENNNTLFPDKNHDVIYNAKAEKEAEKAPLTAGLQIDGTGAPPGIINPLQYRTIKRAVNIDSRFRPNYYTSSATDMQLTLPTRLDKVISMRLGALELPNTFYAISEKLGNNCIKIINTDDDATFTTITIPDGNYSSSSADTTYPSIKEVIKTAIHDATNSNSFLSKLDFNIDEASGKSSFLSNETNKYTIVFGVTSSGDNSSDKLPYFLGWQLGYRRNMYKVEPSKPAVSEGLCQISGPRYVFLSIDDYNNNVNNYFISAYSDSINSRNILSRIDLPHPNEDGFGSQINRTRNYFGPVTIEKMHVRMIDEYDRVIDINNMDWSFTLMFECIY
jgi:hypothetical protein